MYVVVARPVLGCIGRQAQRFELDFPVVDSEGYHARKVIANRAAKLLSQRTLPLGLLQWIISGCLTFAILDCSCIFTIYIFTSSRWTCFAFRIRQVSVWRFCLSLTVPIWLLCLYNSIRKMRNKYPFIFSDYSWAAFGQHRQILRNKPSRSKSTGQLDQMPQSSRRAGTRACTRSCCSPWWSAAVSGSYSSLIPRDAARLR